MAHKLTVLSAWRPGSSIAPLRILILMLSLSSVQRCFAVDDESSKFYVPEKARQHELDGLTILRAIAKHHYGEHGFLTEGVDWNNHVGQEHHINQAEFAAIQYTEPFLNNQHIVEPTLYYLRHLAKRRTADAKRTWYDLEDNVIHSD